MTSKGSIWHHEENVTHDSRKERFEMSVTQVVEQYQSILEKEVHAIAWETGAVQRQGKLDAATFVQMIIFGFWQDPEMRLSGLAQIGGRREVYVTESAISQRFTPASANMFQQIMQRLGEVHLESEKVDIALLKQFSQVIVEDSPVITLPGELAAIWLGCGKPGEAGEAAVKVFVRWNVSSGEMLGPRLADGRLNDHRSPFGIDELPEGSLYITDLGFFGIERLCGVARGKKGKRYFVTRLQPRTNLYDHHGHLRNIKGMLPQQVGQVREVGVILGQKKGLPIRLIMVKVPEKVAKERQARIRRTAQKNGDIPSEEVLRMAHWTIVITNIGRKRASYAEILVLLRLRWQIERLFRLWKEDAKIDEWRSKNPYRILCEFYAKMCAMIIQQSFIQEGCWLDPMRSIVKAADSLRRECNRLMVAFYEGGLQQTVQSLLRTLRSGCRLERRAAFPSTAQLLLDGLDWQLELLVT
jgi:Transposase DDE domain